MATVVSADKNVIGYESVGAGPLLQLVHGSTSTHARWSSVRAQLAQRYTVHAMDRRGRGLSTAEAGPYGLRPEAQDVAAVAEAVGGDVYVVGHSYGARPPDTRTAQSSPLPAVGDERQRDGETP
jgi:pimeloyl-ACP methyl ester carboxylesterase